MVTEDNDDSGDERNQSKGTIQVAVFRWIRFCCGTRGLWAPIVTAQMIGKSVKPTYANRKFKFDGQ